MRSNAASLARLRRSGAAATTAATTPPALLASSTLRRCFSATAGDSAVASTLLLVHRGKVTGFTASRSGQAGPGPVREASGFDTGDRLRCYAGARTGQLLTAVGLRNNAFWVLWDGDENPTGISPRDLPRLDLRLVGRAELTGLSPAEYSEGDPFFRPLYTRDQVEREARVSLKLDDASLQHLVTEHPTNQRCQRCAEGLELKQVTNAVKSLHEGHFMTQRLNRLLRSRCSTMEPLNSVDAINKSVHDTLASFPSTSTPAEALHLILQQRVKEFDDVYRVRILHEDYLLPACLLEMGGTAITPVPQKWVQSIPIEGFPSGTTELRRKGGGVEQVLGLSLLFAGCGGKGDVNAVSRELVARIESFTKAHDAEAATVDLFFNEVTPAELGLEVTGFGWLKSALLRALFTAPEFKDIPGKTMHAFREHLGSDGQGLESQRILLSQILRKEFGALSPHIEVATLPGSATPFEGRVPLVAFETAKGAEVRVRDDDWCREVILSHPNTGAAMRAAEAKKKADAEAKAALAMEEGGAEQKEEEEGDSREEADRYTACLGKEGSIVEKGVGRLGPINASIAHKLLHTLGRYHGHHSLLEAPLAEVFCAEGKYSYLDRACAVELYGNSNDPPMMIDVRGRDQYKSNSWIQPLGLVNDWGLEHFARPWTKRLGYSRRASMHVLDTPAPTHMV